MKARFEGWELLYKGIDIPKAEKQRLLQNMISTWIAEHPEATSITTEELKKIEAKHREQMRDVKSENWRLFARLEEMGRERESELAQREKEEKQQKQTHEAAVKKLQAELAEARSFLGQYQEQSAKGKIDVVVKDKTAAYLNGKLIDSKTKTTKRTATTTTGEPQTQQSGASANGQTNIQNVTWDTDLKIDLERKFDLTKAVLERQEKAQRTAAASTASSSASMSASASVSDDDEMDMNDLLETVDMPAGFDQWPKEIKVTVLRRELDMLSANLEKEREIQRVRQQMHALQGQATKLEAQLKNSTKRLKEMSHMAKEWKDKADELAPLMEKMQPNLPKSSFLQKQWLKLNTTVNVMINSVNNFRVGSNGDVEKMEEEAEGMGGASASSSDTSTVGQNEKKRRLDEDEEGQSSSGSSSSSSSSMPDCPPAQKQRLNGKDGNGGGSATAATAGGAMGERAKQNCWVSSEDEKLRELVQSKRGPNLKPQWCVIGAEMPGRDQKSCRDRYYNHLDPSIDKSPLTREEHVILGQCQRFLGNRFSFFKKLLPGRTYDAISSRFQKGKKEIVAVMAELDNGTSVPNVDSKTSIGKEILFDALITALHKSGVYTITKEALKKADEEVRQ